MSVDSVDGGWGGRNVGRGRRRPPGVELASTSWWPVAVACATPGVELHVDISHIEFSIYRKSSATSTSGGRISRRHRGRERRRARGVPPRRQLACRRCVRAWL